jgi:Na+-transporting NADH:ubiquinone oxidoreductase subunit NqrB
MMESFIGFPGSVGETSTIALLDWPVFYYIQGIGSWRIMASVLQGGL